jgi:alpha-1,3-glucosyltransferase
MKLGVTVILTFGLMFYPWLNSADEISQVIHRIFPVARGLYEDKVANVWCAINVAIKLKQILSVDSTVKLSLAVTLAVIIPTAIHLGVQPTRNRFLYALVNASLGFFLFSFQVHEKSILLPALPVTLLLMEEPIACTLFMNIAMFSMFPLLKREGLQLPYFVVTAMWNWLTGGYDPKTSSMVKFGTYVSSTDHCYLMGLSNNIYKH